VNSCYRPEFEKESVSKIKVLHNNNWNCTKN